MCKWGTYVKVKLPKHIAEDEHEIEIDSCILDTMAFLWDHHIETTGCCCGHGRMEPSIVITDKHTDEDIVRIKGLLFNCDRRWRIYQWRCVEV